MQTQQSGSRFARHCPSGRVSPAALIGLVSVLILAAVFIGIFALNRSAGPPEPGKGELVVYCAAGIKPPVEELAKAYTKAYGVPIRIVPGSSGSLLGTMQVRRAGDLYIPADMSFVELGREKDLLRESLPLARFRLVLAVAPNNPRQIKSIEDLLWQDVSYAIADPKAGVGKLTRKAMTDLGHWPAIDENKRTMKGTVTEVAMVVKQGSVDAAFMWDSTARQFGLDIVPIDALAPYVSTMQVSVLEACEQPADALRFARYLTSPQHGNPVFDRHHYEPIPGDKWAVTPEITLYSGTVSRPAIEKTLAAFQQREGCKLTTAFHGCGTLVGMMQTETMPDAYLACDISYRPFKEAEHFSEPTIVSEMDLVMLVRRDSDKPIRTLADLAKPGLRIGLADPQRAALGGVTRVLLEEAGLYQAVQQNLKTANGGGDLLVAQMTQHTTLDAVIVYGANCLHVDDSKFEQIRIDHPRAVAIQPWWARTDSDYPRLTQRLLDALRTAESRQRYDAAGFRFKAE